MQMHTSGEPLPCVRPPRVDSTPPPAAPTAPAPAQSSSRELVTYALANLLLHWGGAEPVLLTSAAVGVYLGLWRADVALLALLRCERVDARGIPWSGRVVLNAPRFLEAVEVDAPDALAMITPRDLAELFEEATTRPFIAPRYPGLSPGSELAVRGDLLLRAVQSLASDEDDVLALWWTDQVLHLEGPGFRVILHASEVPAGVIPEEQWFEGATVEDVLRARLARHGDTL